MISEKFIFLTTDAWCLLKSRFKNEGWKVRLEDLSTVTSTVAGDRIDPLYNVLASYTTHVVCINFIREWRDLQFNVDSKRQIFFSLRNFFFASFIYSQRFCQKSTERKWPKEYFFFHNFDVRSGIRIRTLRLINQRLYIPCKILTDTIRSSKS